MPHASDRPPQSPPKLGETGRILEGVVTTRNSDGTVNIAPMGPIVGERFDRLRLRPFQTSVTFQNLKRTGRGVFHVTDDVELLAQAAIGRVEPPPRMLTAGDAAELILADACRWYAFEVETLDESAERTSIVARVTDRGTLREFLGFNRAKHAVLEAAILATRVHLTGARLVLAEFDRLSVAVEKTGAATEHRAMQLLRRHVESLAAGAQQ